MSLCMLACYVELHMRQALKPVLFDDHDRADAAKHRLSMGAPAERSGAAMRKARYKQKHDGLPVHSFQTLLADLATIARSTVEVKTVLGHPVRFQMVTQPTDGQQRAITLLAIKLIL